jgi:hypothetical protein
MKHHFLIALSVLICVCIVQDLNAGAGEIDAQRAAKQHMYPVTPQIQAVRTQLVREYKDLLTTLFPSYNGIEVRFSPNVYGPEWGFLQASHSFFSPYTFDVGPAGPAVQRWVSEHHDQLTEARIVTVGVVGDGPGSVSFNTGVLPPFSRAR